MGTLKLIVVAMSLWLVGMNTPPLSNGSVKGTVVPADAAVRAWIMSASDTLKANIDRGIFMIPDAKPGVYKMIIEARPPFKNAVKEAVMVTDGIPCDVGEIRLTQ
jgi:hypothetical protein